MVGVEVDGQRHVRIVLLRVRYVLRDQGPEVIEVKEVPGAGDVLIEQSGENDGVVSGRNRRRDLHVSRGAAVLHEVEIDGDSAGATPSTVTPILPQSVFRNVPR